MSLEKTIEGIVAIFIAVIFMTSVIPELTKATGINIPFISFAFILIIIGIIIAIIKSWMD
ncbi:MAG: hypothetical protein V1886_02595 [archaeon]